jgi:hypothetical protein
LRIDIDFIGPASREMRFNMTAASGSVRQSAAARRACCRTIGIASVGSPSPSTRSRIASMAAEWHVRANEQVDIDVDINLLPPIASALDCQGVDEASNVE